MIEVRVIPNAARTELTGMRDGAYVLRVHAPPRDGKANREVVKYLAEIFGVSRSGVRIVRGENGRLKTIEVLGLKSSDGIGRLQDLAGGRIDT
jgi:uncharacterized protein (TIGR00251 family)